MLRIWSEFLDYEEAAQPKVLDLLARHEVHPIFAVRPDSNLDALAELLRAAERRALAPGIWPLLARDEGYWPNEKNHRSWGLFADGIVRRLDKGRARPRWVAVDMEPPIDQVTALLRDVTSLAKALRKFARRNLERSAYDLSIDAWSEVLEGLHRRDVHTLGVTVPLAAHDLGEAEPFWQDLLQTPWAALPFHRKGIMAYNSMVAGYSRGLLSVRDARAAHDRLVERTVETFGADEVHVSIGLTGPGVLGDEPAYVESFELARDASAVRARGVSDIGLFCLEGLLQQHDPDRWLGEVVAAEPLMVDPTRRSEILRRLGRAARGLGMIRTRLSALRG